MSFPDAYKRNVLVSGVHENGAWLSVVSFGWLGSGNRRCGDRGWRRNGRGWWCLCLCKLRWHRLWRVLWLGGLLRRVLGLHGLGCVLRLLRRILRLLRLLWERRLLRWLLWWLRCTSWEEWLWRTVSRPANALRAEVFAARQYAPGHGRSRRESLWRKPWWRVPGRHSRHA